MDEPIITIYCLCDDLLHTLHHHEDLQCRMSDAEVMTTALVAARFFKGNLEQARIFLKTQHYILGMLSKSRLIRRLHRIRPLFLTLFDLLGETWKARNGDSIYSIDSFPIAVCDNYRIRRAKLYQRPDCRGYLASKHRYFYGLKVHLLVTQAGQPVEFFLTPGAWSDVGCLDSFELDLPPASTIYADRGYTNYRFEDDLLETSGIRLLPMRKRNSKRPFPPWVEYLQHYFRKRIETVGSLLQQLLPKSIHAVKAVGFELKVVLFILTLSINCL
jgi:Transposase DDE domain